MVFSGKNIVHQIKATLGITGQLRWRAHIKYVVWHLDVG